jgi:predicted transcriptional regulator YheO
MTEFLDAGCLIRDFTNFADYGKGNPKGETFAVSLDETIDSLLGEAIERIGKQPPNMQMDDKISLVEILDKKGAFLVKGALSHIAALLGVSKFTIYRYLEKAKAREGINTL